MIFPFIFASLLFNCVFAYFQFHKNLQRLIQDLDFDGINGLLRGKLNLLIRFEPETWFHALGFHDNDECKNDHDDRLNCNYYGSPVVFSSLKQISFFMADNFEDVNAKVKNSTPLSIALLRRNSGAVKRLCLRQDLDVNLPFKEDSEITPLLLAMKLNHPDLVKMLVEKGANINSSCDGLSLLHHACKLSLGLNRDKILRFLFTNNVEVQHDGPAYELSHSTNWAEEVIKHKLELVKIELLNRQRKRFVMVVLLLFLVIRQFIKKYYN